MKGFILLNNNLYFERLRENKSSIGELSLCFYLAHIDGKFRYTVNSNT